MKNTTIHFNTPASVWEEALPLGNGSLGAMIHGGIDTESIQLNQESVWSSGPLQRNNPSAREALPKVRQLLAKGQLSAAEQLIYEDMLADPITLGHYEPLADLKLVFDRKIPHYSEMFAPQAPAYTDYERSLDLEKSLYRCSFQKPGNKVMEREALISYPDQVLAMQIRSNSAMSLRVELSRGDAFDTLYTEGDTILLKGQCSRNAPEFVCMAKVVTDGTVKSKGYYLTVENARYLCLYAAGRTSYYKDYLASSLWAENHSSDLPEDFYQDPTLWCLDRLTAAAEKGYEAIKKDHIDDVTALFNRVELDLGEKDGQSLSAERFYNFGRYLTIAGSRPGCLPTNLQGLWNKDFHPSWGSRYTININLQMNYWLAESANLSECHMPLLDFISSMVENGRTTAAAMYDCRGAVAHHNTDIYGDCAPNEHWMPASLWPMGLGWLGTHLIEHYRFTQNVDFCQKFLPVLAELCLFYLDYMFKDENGNLVTGPSTSPENTYILPNGEKSTACLGPAMDIQIVRELWEGYLEMQKACMDRGTLYEEEWQKFEKRYGISFGELGEAIAEKLPKLPPSRIGTRGQLLEWQEEYEEWEPGHRHISHLFGLYPGNSITKERDPAALEAAKITLKERLAHGGGGTGWSRSWLINFYARLGDGANAFANLETLLKEQTAPNLFDLHPPIGPGMSTVFQIDGNYGAAAGISEMLVQTVWDATKHCWTPLLLPALPAEWAKKGHVRGLRIRGNQIVDMAWEDGIITECRITPA